MPRYAYIAVDSNKKAINGFMEQPDRASVISAIRKQHLRPVSVKLAPDKKVKSSFENVFNSSKVKNDHLVIMTRQLSVMVGAGVPLIRSLKSLAEYSESDALKQILIAVIKDVEAGSNLGDALGNHPATFNDVYVNMVRAGEAAGILEDILKRLAIQQEKSTTIRKKVKSAMAYPAVLVVITVLAFFGLMLFVIPQIGKVLLDLGGPDAELPGITLMMLGISDAFTNYWYIIFPAIFGIIYAFVQYIKTPKGRLQIDTLILNTPIVRKIAQKIAIARFARTFSALMGAGVAVVECLRVTSHSIGNVVYEQAILDAVGEVKNGRSLSSVLGQNELFPAIVAQMLAVGEETGQTDTVLLKVADFYEEEVDTAIESVSSIIEPVMILIMGSMVGLIAASVMMPIASLSQSIK